MARSLLFVVERIPLRRARGAEVEPPGAIPKLGLTPTLRSSSETDPGCNLAVSGAPDF